MRTVRRVVISAALIAVAAICALAVYSRELKRRASYAPSMVSVSECKAVSAGMRRIDMRRIDTKTELQFDVAMEGIVVHTGCTDAPPLTCGATITLRDDPSARLNIGYSDFSNPAGIDSLSTFSEHEEQREIHDAEGRVVGREKWGYLKTGERWRRVHFRRESVTAEYGFTKRKSAERFDQIIGSVCFLR